MKKTLLKAALYMSARLFKILITVCIFSSLGLANTGRAQSISEVEISISMSKAKLPAVFAEIEKKTQFKFAYDQAVNNSNWQMTLNLKSKSVEKILEYITTQTGLLFKQNENNISVSSKNLKTSNTTSSLEPFKITGKVTDGQSGEAMPGVNVLIKGTVIGVATDKDGVYSIQLDDNNSDTKLVFSFIGYSTQEIAVDNRTIVDVVLLADTKALQEIVVIGYGEQSKEKITGAISQVKSEQLGSYSASGFAQQLAGKAAGVTINDASAQPGTDPQIIIRGIGTLTAGRNPLIVVDGMPLSEGSALNSINPQDIETLEVLKDAASASIYGSRAANGVILITTKKGKDEKVKISFDAYSGFQERSDNVHLLDGYDYALYSTEARDYSYVGKDPAHRSANDDRAVRVANEGGASSVNLRDLRLNYIQPYLDRQPGLTNTNWLNKVFRAAKLNNYSLSLHGGTPKSNYYLSTNYFEQDGIVLGSGYKRYSSSLKINSAISDRVDFGLSLNPSYGQQNFVDNSSDRNIDPISMALTMYPFFKPYNADGSLAISQQIIANTPEDGALEENPVAFVKLVKNKRNLFRTFGNTFLSMKFIDGLKYQIRLGGDYNNTFNDFFNPSNVGGYRTAAPKPATASQTNGFAINYLIENTLNYNKSLGDHSLEVLAGYTFQKESGNTSVISGTGIPDNNISNIAGATSFNVTNSGYVWTQISYLARAQYSFKDKFLASAATRRDGSSRFGAYNRFGNFPSVALGWIISKEPFFPENKIIDFAKLRMSWGKTGNNQIGSYSSIGLVSQDNYVYGVTLAPGYTPANAPNPNLAWEVNASYNGGIDLKVFDKFTVSANYYSATTSKLLLNVPVPEQSGYNIYLKNNGSVRNRGLEFEISGNEIRLGPVKWSFTGNISANRNKVISLAPGQQQIITGQNNSFLTKVGGPIAQLYGYNVIGVYKSSDEINSSPHLANAQVGDYMVADTNHDGVIDQKDKLGFGTYSPKFTYGFTNNFSYKEFDFSFSWTGVQGRKIYDNGLIGMESGESFAMGDKYYFDHRYHPTDNPTGFLAQPTTNSGRAAWQGTLSSNIFINDASYLRLRSVQVGYNIPAHWLARMKGTKARIYLTANNPLTFTHFRGFNPDATTSSVLTNGYSYSNYPVAKSYLVGINLTF